MVNGSDLKKPKPEHGQNDTPDMKDPAGSDDIDESMSTQLAFTLCTHFLLFFSRPANNNHSPGL